MNDFNFEEQAIELMLQKTEFLLNEQQKVISNINNILTEMNIKYQSTNNAMLVEKQQTLNSKISQQYENDLKTYKYLTEYLNDVIAIKRKNIMNAEDIEREIL